MDSHGDSLRPLAGYHLSHLLSLITNPYYQNYRIHQAANTNVQAIKDHRFTDTLNLVFNGPQSNDIAPISITD